MKKTIRIATRQSPLALWQARFVRDLLTTHYPTLSVELIPLTTKGDILLNTPLSAVGGKGLFVKELELALLTNRADIAVHSMKDVPVSFADGLELSTICQREDPRDVFVSNRYTRLAELPLASIVGTSSLRRQCQLKALRKDLIVQSVRGNIGTRLAKLDQPFAAIILASAGLKRLNMADSINEYLPIDLMLPAAGQGAIGIECRQDDLELKQLLLSLHHQQTADCVNAERALLRHLNGGCQVPIGCFAQLTGSQLRLQALVGSIDGQSIIKNEIIGAPEHGETLALNLAERLLSQGAEQILYTSCPNWKR